jgi:hypothetical protein
MSREKDHFALIVYSQPCFSHQVEFVCFFLGMLLLRSCLPSLSAEKWFLLIASYCFYGTWSMPGRSVLLFISVSDYLIGCKLGKTGEPNSARTTADQQRGNQFGSVGIFLSILATPAK